MRKFYPAAQHNITRALADIRYPVTKEALIRQTGERIVQVDFEKKVPLKEIFQSLPLSEFSCAAELYNNIACVFS
jgi:hypothetical protein